MEIEITISLISLSSHCYYYYNIYKNPILKLESIVHEDAMKKNRGRHP